MSETDKAISRLNQIVLGSDLSSPEAKKEAKESEEKLRPQRFVLTDEHYRELVVLRKSRYPQEIAYHLWQMLWSVFAAHETQKKALGLAMKPLQKFHESHKAGCCCEICNTYHQIQELLKPCE